MVSGEIPDTAVLTIRASGALPSSAALTSDITTSVSLARPDRVEGRHPHSLEARRAVRL
jgi:hypothetical protein